MKKGFVFLTSIIASLSMSMVTFAGTWQLQDDGHWKYLNDDGTYSAGGWVNDAGKDYYVGADGNMLVNSVTPDGYYVGSDGVWVKDYVTPLFDLDIGNSHVKYTGYEINTDYKGDSCIVVYYDFTNKDSEPKSAMGSNCYIEAYQNGVECDSSFISSGEENTSMKNPYKSIMPGVTINVAEVFKITDRTPVILSLSNLFSYRDRTKTYVTIEIH